MTPVALVIFDNNGVLIDSEPIAMQVLALELTACGVPITADEVGTRYAGWTLGQVMTDVDSHIDKPLPADFVVRHQASLMAAFRLRLQRRPGVGEALEWLDSAGIPSCVASNSTRARLLASLEIVGLMDRFDESAFCVEDVTAGKPEPDIFLHAARAMGADPDRCVVIEDTRTGITAARAAVMRVIAVRGTHTDSELADAEVIPTDLRDLLAAISVMIGDPGPPRSGP